VTEKKSTAAVALDGAAAKLREWSDAERELAVVQARVDKLRAEFKATMVALGVERGTVNGVDVLSHKPISTFRGSEFAKARPDLAEQYTRGAWVKQLDTVALKAELPEVYAQYLATQLRPNFKALDAALGGGGTTT